MGIIEMQKQQLLLVEDSEDDAFLFLWAFEKSGIALEVHHVLDGFEAVNFLREAQNLDCLPQIILLDLKMPILNGFEVLAWLQNQTFSSRVPVVVLSGSAQQQDKDKALHLGAIEYLVKPVAVADLHRLLGIISGGPMGANMAKSGAPC
jgi:chemotaxis family two-component system response regulator Rcp1